MAPSPQLVEEVAVCRSLMRCWAHEEPLRYA
jgi:hypothetical protein